MSRTVCALVVLFLCVQSATAEAPYPIAWVRQYGTSNIDRSYSIAVTPGGQTYIAAAAPGDNIVSYDTDGNRLWAKTVASPTLVSGSQVTTDALGNCYFREPTRTLTLMKIDPGGTPHSSQP